MDRKFEKNQRQVPVSNGFRLLWPPNYPSTSPDQYERAFNFGGDVTHRIFKSQRCVSRKTERLFCTSVPSTALDQSYPMGIIRSSRVDDCKSKRKLILFSGPVPSICISLAFENVAFPRRCVEKASDRTSTEYLAVRLTHFRIR